MLLEAKLMTNFLFLACLRRIPIVAEMARISAKSARVSVHHCKIAENIFCNSLPQVWISTPSPLKVDKYCAWRPSKGEVRTSVFRSYHYPRVNVAQICATQAARDVMNSTGNSHAELSVGKNAQDAASEQQDRTWVSPDPHK